MPEKMTKQEIFARRQAGLNRLAEMGIITRGRPIDPDNVKIGMSPRSKLRTPDGRKFSRPRSRNQIING